MLYRTERQMTRLSQPLHTATGPTELHGTRSRYLFGAGICALVLLLLFEIVTISRQAPWLDEIFVVSTGLSLARSRPPIESVMAQYPRADSPIQFYGPVSFEAEAQLIRRFGLSIAAWRITCFAGVVLTLLVSAALVKLAGGDRWAQLATALIIALAGSLGSTLPGRWDAVTSGLFLCALLLLLRGVELGRKALIWRAILAGVFLGLALSSTPRTLTLIAATAITTLIVAVRFRKQRKSLLLGTVGMFVVAVSIQSLLLLPWGLNTLSWYAYVRQATKEDSINATAVAGRGTLNFDLHYHKTFFLVFLLLLLIGVLGVLARRKFSSHDEKIPIKIFMTFFAAVNLALMLLLLAQALGQSVFWLPPTVIATMCWFDWDLFRAKALGPLVAAVVAVCLLVLLFADAQRLASTIITWNRRSNADLASFVRRTVKSNAVVYGPVSGSFYPVELAGAQYLYVYEQARAGRLTEPHALIADKLEEEICAHPTYAMWPNPDPAFQPEEEPMPQVLRDRLLPKVGEFLQPPLSPTKEKLLNSLGTISGKYGFPDATIYPLRSLNDCGRD
jgi:hypothetical protein